MSIEEATNQWYVDYYSKKGKERNSLQNPEVLFQTLAMEAAFVRATYSIRHDFRRAAVLDVGCGGGDIYLLLRCGYRPENITGIDILPDRIEKARSLYPHIRFIVGDAGKMDLPPESYDLIFESTMFVQTTDNALAKTIADEMLRVLKPGGYVLLIDWRMPKPGDKRYKALTRRRLESLFEIGHACQILATQKGALAPPIGRALSKYLPACYFAVASCLPFLVAQAAYLLKKA